MLEIDEDQLRQLIVQYQQNMAGQPGSPIYNEDGEPIQLSHEEYEAALLHFQQL
jgi:hypothetical protein